MVLLVLFYSHFVKSNYQTEEFVNIYSLFACYLVTCGVWNIIILKIMKRIKFVSLLKSLFQGNTFELEHLKEYTEDFITKYEEKEKKLEIEFDNARKKNGFKDGLKKVKKGGRKLIPQINLARALAQYIANYILWINFWVASMILLLAFNFHEHLFFFNNLYKMLKIPLNLETFQIALLLIVSVVLISIVFFIQLNSVYNKRLFGNLLILFLLIFYSIFSVQILIYILVVQQIFIGFAIQVITDGIKSVELEYGDN